MAVDVRIITQVVGVDDVKRQIGGISDETKKAGDQAEKTKGKFSGLVGTVKGLLPALGVGAVVAGIGKIIQVTSDAEQTAGKFETVFADLTDSTRAWAKETGQAVGISQVEMESYLATLQDLFVPMKFTREESAEMSKQFVELAADLSAFNDGITQSQALEKLRSGIIGNHEALLDFGVVITQAELEQELLNMGIEGGVKAANAQEKALARMNLIMAGTTDAQGAAARETETFAGQMKLLIAAATDLAVAIGETGLLKAVTSLVGGIVDVVRAMADAVKGTTAWVKELLGLEDAIEDVNKASVDEIKGEMTRLGEEIADVRKEAELTGGVGVLDQKQIDEKVSRLKELSERYEQLTRDIKDVGDEAQKTGKDQQRANRIADLAAMDAIETERRKQEVIRQTAGVTKASAESTKDFNREIISSVEGVTTSVCREAKEQAKCQREGQIIVEKDAKRLAKEVIRSAEGVTISVCREVKEQVECQTEGQIIVERESRKATKKIKQNWVDMYDGILDQTETWETQILETITGVIAAIVEQIGGGIDVGLNFNVSVSGAGGAKEEEKVAAAIIGALAGAFGIPGGGLLAGLPFIGDLGEILGDIGGEIWDALKNIGGFIGDAIGDVVDFFGDLFGGFFQGGGDFVAQKPMLIGVGEHGPERVRIGPLGAHGGGGTTVIFQGPTVMNEIGMRRFTRGLDSALSSRRHRYG